MRQSRLVSAAQLALLAGAAAPCFGQADLCVNATAIGTGNYAGTTVGATNDGTASCGNSATSPDVWFKITPVQNQQLTISTCGGASWDTVLSVRTGCPGSEVACVDDSCNFQTTLVTPVTGGQTYYIRVAGYGGATGAFTLNVALDDPPPPGTGPDVTLLDIPDISNHGVVGSVRAYSLGSSTCNIGNLNLIWANGGTPGLGQNMFRLFDGRLEQIGVGFAKTACCAAAGSGPCGTCNGAGGSVLGAGCLDVYGAGWNAQQSRLAPRSTMNAFTGAFSGFAATSGDAVFKRLQVLTSDLNQTTYAGGLYFIEGVYVGSDDAAQGNQHNNATYKRVTVNGATGDLTMVGAAQTRIPAIRAWRDHGLGANVVDPSVAVGTLDVPAEGRFWYACKVRDNGNGTWRYNYAVYNLSSDRAGGSFSVPVPAGVNITNVGFHAPFYHSGEPASFNDAWTSSVVGGAVVWSTPQTFAQNANSSAIRWGSMHTFWFTADSAPTAANVTLGLFKPHSPQSVQIAVQGPSAIGGGCYANCDGSTSVPVLTVADFGCFLNAFAAGASYANCDGSTTVPVLTVADFGCFLNRFAAGCT